MATLELLDQHHFVVFVVGVVLTSMRAPKAGSILERGDRGTPRQSTGYVTLKLLVESPSRCSCRKFTPGREPKQRAAIPVEGVDRRLYTLPNGSGN